MLHCMKYTKPNLGEAGRGAVSPICSVMHRGVCGEAAVPGRGGQKEESGRLDILRLCRSYYVGGGFLFCVCMMRWIVGGTGTWVASVR